MIDLTRDKVKVGVRVRPLNSREKSLQDQNQLITSVPGGGPGRKNQIILTHPPPPLSSTNHHPTNRVALSKKKSFTFDHVFDLDSGQADVFNALGHDLLASSFDGYNACLFAYGQTGSGKSYTMLGSNEQRGVIPRLCDAIFNRISDETANGNSAPTQFKVEVSFMEIYNEKVRDLLVPNSSTANKTTLKVREHALLGPYVDGLSILAVQSAEDVANLMAEGNKSRTVAATNMNSESSRSHAVFTIVMTQTLEDSGVIGEKVSKISLVDLAGSERALKTGAVGERLKEGSNINKSLTTLGLVISKLADGSTGAGAKDSNFIPYRDSCLTWLLKDNLGGNSRTIMIATVSPAPDNYEETLSTLRYADRAKRIVNHAVINEDPNAKLIRELQAEVKQLRELLKNQNQSSSSTNLNEQLHQSEKLMRQISEPWEDKLHRSEQIQIERQAALEKMGISVQQSGISVEKDRFYLVNLNADPALNELLVYYLKENRTLVGRPDAPGDHPPDIQLTGLGIEELHCELVIEPEDQTLYLIPYPNAHTCVNGERIVERKKVLRHGDRILWGNHHFFRLNSPVKTSSQSAASSSALVSTTNLSTTSIDDSSSTSSTTQSQSFVGFENAYEKASAEFSMKQLIISDPIHDAVAKLESKHKKDKEVALERQRQEFERQFNAMMHVLSPSSPLPPSGSFIDLNLTQCPTAGPSSSTSSSIGQITAARNTKMSEGLKLLKDYLLKANSMVREANEITEAMNFNIKYTVTLLIPPNNLTPNRPKGALVTEPSIRVERPGHYSQMWSMEKLENHLVDMREAYNDDLVSTNDEINDPDPPIAFFEPDQPHVLLGIANVFLQVLFYEDVVLRYPVPVINQQGEIVGRLHVEVAKVSAGGMQPNAPNATTTTSLYEEYEDDDSGSGSSDPNVQNPKTITVKVTLRHLAGVTSSHYVFCQYVFCDNFVVVPPTSTTSVVRFDDTKYFTVQVSEEFLDYCMESALSIEIWGHRGNQQNNNINSGPTTVPVSSAPAQPVQIVPNETNNNSVTDRWKEVTSQMKLWAEIQELNENGDYVPVDIEYNDTAGTGGIYQLRQGLQRRILISVETSATIGHLPVVCDEIDQVSLGAITLRSTTLQLPLDSYQEVDLTVLRQKWGEALKRRREYLDRHLQDLASKSEKNPEEISREKSLVSQWLTLTEERNAVLVPAPDSGVPGAPSSSIFKPEQGMEEHMPVIFLDISEDVLSADSSSPHSPPMITGQTAGLESLLPKEHDSQFVGLPMIRKSYGDFYSAWSDQRMSTESWALVSWDSSVHDCSVLNKPTPPGEVIYVILRIALRLSHPVQMDCILRKRICFMVKRNRPSITERLMARFSIINKRTDDWVGGGSSNGDGSGSEKNKKRTGVTYQIVSHLPKSSEQLETRENLAHLAVSHGEAYIEEYLRSISAVDSILNLDRMRQSVHLREEQSKLRGPPGRLNSRLQQNHGQVTPSIGSAGGVGNFMRKTLSVPNISQLFIPSSNSMQGHGQQLPHLQRPGQIILENGNHPGAGGSSGSIRTNNKPLRSESLANLSGFTSMIMSPTGSGATGDNEQQGSPSTARPSSLNLQGTSPGGTGAGPSPQANTITNITPHGTKWTTMMSTVMEEEKECTISNSSSGYGSKSSNEDSPTK